jgi:hypothetical protein
LDTNISNWIDPRSDRDSLDLVEGDVVAGAVVESGRPRRFVGGDRLAVFNRAAVLEIPAIVVARKVSQEVEEGKAAARARRLIIDRKTPRLIAAHLNPRSARSQANKLRSVDLNPRADVLAS